MLTFARLAGCQAMRPGLAYIVRGAPYLALTDQSPTDVTLLASRGPKFLMPTDSGFVPLGEAPEPSSEELAAVVLHLYQDEAGSSRGSMGECDPGVAFAGLGDPLLRLEVLLDTVRLVAEAQNGVPFRVITTGLVSPDVTDKLVASGLVALGGADQRRETMIQTISVALPCHTEARFKELVQPGTAYGFGEVCGFISNLSEAGAIVECTCVARPDVDVEATRKLALALGAASFRERSFHA